MRQFYKSSNLDIETTLFHIEINSSFLIALGVLSILYLIELHYFIVFRI